MRKTTLLLTLLLSCIIATVQIRTIPPVKAVDVVVIPLPEDAIPLGITWDGGDYVYAVSYWYGALYKLDKENRSLVATYYPRGENSSPCLRGICIGPNNTVWISGGSIIARFDPETETFTEVDGLERAFYKWVTYYYSYIWVVSARGKLYKIDPDTTQIIEIFTVPGNLIYCKPDGSYLWITDIVGGRLHKFNVETETLEHTYEGFERPLGIEVDSQFVYVAENVAPPNPTNECGKIAKLDKQTGNITRISTNAKITREGPYFLMFDLYGSLWWTDNSNHYGVITPTGETYVYDSSSPYCYYMTVVRGSFEVWLSATGASSHIYVIDIPLGDITRDGKIDMRDLSIVARSFGTYPSHPDWNPEADITEDGKIDMRDLATVARNFGKLVY